MLSILESVRVMRILDLATIIASKPVCKAQIRRDLVSNILTSIEEVLSHFIETHKIILK